MSYPITHIVVKDTPPPMQVITIGQIYQIPPEPEVVFSTVRLEEDEAEVKVVRRGRRPAAKANEAAETK